MELSNHLTSFFEVIAKLPQKKIAQAISGLLLVYIAYVAAQATWLLAPKHNAVDRSGNVVTSYAPVQQKQNINVKKLIQLHIFPLMFYKFDHYDLFLSFLYVWVSQLLLDYIFVKIPQTQL